MRALALWQAALLLAAGCGGGAKESDEPAYDPRADRRFAPLVTGCFKSDYYDRNLADVVPILVEKLATGARDPQTRAKEELAAMGDAALPELRRFVERHYAETYGIAYLHNAIDVLTRIESDGAHEILMRCLEHPGDAIRSAALQGLRVRHARPEDFDRLLAHLDVEVEEQKHQVAVALHKADAARAEALYLEWLRAGERPGLHVYLAPLLAASRRAETRAACAELYAGAAPEIAAHLAAPAAAAGDAQARKFLRRELGLMDEEPEENRQRRASATAAAAAAELEDLLIEVLARDPDASIRVLAADALASKPEEPLSEPARDALRYGLDDLSPLVRRACLGALVERGDAVAADRALAELGAGPAALSEAMSALVHRLASDPELATRAYDALLARNELESFLPLKSRLSTLKSIGQIPKSEAALLLRRLGLEHASETVEGLRAHEWTTLHAANTGDEGRAALLEELGGESDPARRVDLLWAVSAARTDATRAALLALIESGELGDFEVLFVADKLARLGPATEIAPRLKRVAHRMESDEVRALLQCLLWQWY